MPNLLPTQKNAIFHRVKEAGLNPTDFLWKVRDGYPTLVHRTTGFYCQFYPLRTFELKYSPAGTSFETSIGSLTWEGVQTRVLEWLSDVKREIEEPDLWAELKKEREFIETISRARDDYEPFTAEEQGQIEEALATIKAQLFDLYQLSAEQKHVIEEGFEELKTASTRVGRKDWLMLFLGWLMARILDGTLPPDLARGLLKTAGQVLHIVFQHIGLLPP